MFVQYSVPLLSTQFLVWVHPHLTPYVVPIIHISLTGSVYSVVSVALERFITVCFPFSQSPTAPCSPALVASTLNFKF